MYYSDGFCDPAEYVASCPNGSWEVQTNLLPSGCNPPPPPSELCPEAPPSVGEWCDVVDSVVCSFPDACCSVDYSCVDNTWIDVSPVCDPGTAICPETQPVAGAACDSNPCTSPTYCNYGDCTPDSGMSYAVMSCENGAWISSSTGCTGDAGT